MDSNAHVSLQRGNLATRAELDSSTEPFAISDPLSHLTVPHRVIFWPCISQLLYGLDDSVVSDLTEISKEGTKWFIKQDVAKHSQPLPGQGGLPSSTDPTLPEGTFSGATSFPTLTAAKIKDYTRAYFDTFNLLVPILELEEFEQTTLKRLSRVGYIDGDPNAVLALLVFALGELAGEAVFGRPISISNGVSSGFRGGDLEHPPGLYLFNEARKRLGLVDALCGFESVQILLLQASYYEANGLHVAFWKTAVAASMTIQVLLKCRDFEWTSYKGDITSRLYWACLCQEELYHLDLDLPSSGLQHLQDTIPLPMFYAPPGPFHDPEQLEERLFFQHHFLAIIALRRLIVRIHVTVHDPVKTKAESPDNHGGMPYEVIRELGRQLESWRTSLPIALQWFDSANFRFPGNVMYDGDANDMSFSPEDGDMPTRHKSFDVLNAQLRTRFYYARYILYRPFVFKILHFPGIVSAVDMDNCALAIDSMCLWPSLMGPLKAKKRVVPHLYAWTQNILGILLIFRMIGESALLRQICDDGGKRYEDILQTTTLMLDWMNDAKQVDGIAEWACKVLDALFPGRSAEGAPVTL